jgi:hypothetical protein
MRNARFKDYLRGLLATPDTGVTAIETVAHKGVDVLRVHLDSGLVVDLLVTNTTPPGGDSHDQPERIVTKDGRDPRPVTITV